MRKPRQYRGGCQSSGLKDFAQAERKKATEAESLLWAIIKATAIAWI